MMNIVKLISDKLNSSIENEGSASLVLSGGSSPIRIYEELSNVDISWSRVFLTLVDDRFVDPDHKDSNQKLLYNHFIKNKAKDIKFFPLSENFLTKEDFKKLARNFSCQFFFCTCFCSVSFVELGQRRFKFQYRCGE